MSCLKGLEAKISLLFLMYNFKDFMEKEPYKFYSVLISFHEIM